MSQLNFKHLRYFHAVSTHGSVTAAAEFLHVSQPAVSTQIRKLEDSLGHLLFDRSGRGMELTPEGRVVLEYARDIFRLGQELMDTVTSGVDVRPTRLVIGVAANIPNMVVFHFLESAMATDDPVRLVIRQNTTERLLADLATHDLDVVLADMPIPADVNVRAYNHPLGSSPIDILAPPLLAHRLRPGFPRSLTGQPMFLPVEGYVLRRSLEEWFAVEGVRPRVTAEIEASDLINAFAEAGAGMFAAPAIISDDLRLRYAVEVVGRAEGVSERFFAITAERRIRHPAVVAIREAARAELGITVPG